MIFKAATKLKYHSLPGYASQTPLKELWPSLSRAANVFLRVENWLTDFILFLFYVSNMLWQAIDFVILLKYCITK